MESLQKLYDRLGKQIEIVEKTLKQTDLISNRLNKLVLPINESIQLEGSTAEKSAESPFRQIKFRFKSKPTINHPLLLENKNKPISYTNLCHLLISYITTNKLSINGQIQCDDFLKQICGENQEQIDFFILLKNLGKIIV